MIRPCSVSTRNIRPGCSRSFTTMFSGGMSSTPTSDAMIDEVVLGHVVARRPQAVAIEHRADHAAVGEGNRRRAVPRLHQRRVVLVERPPLRAASSRGPATARGSSSGCACGSDRPAMTRNSSTLSKVAVSLPPSRMIGSIFFRSSPSTSDSQQRLAGAHPVDVAAQRVDLAVVRDVAVRVRQRPRRERVGAEALVDERERRLDDRVGEIGEHRLRSGRPSACPCRSACCDDRLTT